MPCEATKLLQELRHAAGICHQHGQAMRSQSCSHISPYLCMPHPLNCETAMRM